MEDDSLFLSLLLYSPPLTFELYDILFLRNLPLGDIIYGLG
jgi:hypothetical protein